MTEMHNTGVPSTAIEPALPSPPSPAFAAGVAVGLVVAAIAAQLWLAQHLEPLTQWQLDVELRSLSSLALSPLWRWGVPATFAAALGGLLALRVRHVLVYAVVAAAAVLALALTYLWAMDPFTELAGHIRG